MKGLNRVQLVGQVVGQPQMQTVGNSNLPMATVSIKMTDKVKKNGVETKVEEIHTVKAFGKVAENISKYFKPNSKVLVEGKLKANRYNDKRSGEERYFMDVNIGTALLLNSGNGNNMASYQQPPQQHQNNDDEDWPF